MSIREAVNAGAFYPAKKEEIDNLIDYFNNSTKDRDESIKDIKPKAIISPHAGYVYSGFGANLAHKALAKNGVRRVVVIGPSHYVAFNGISGSYFDEYETPYGNLKIDLEYLNIMSKHFNIGFIKESHNREHSTETQMPFIAKYQPEVKVIELIYSQIDYKELAKVVEWLLSDSLTTVVISSDLSHFHDLKRAEFLDSICINGVSKLDIDILDIGCEACGITGIKSVIASAKELNLKSKILDYSTSADVTNDKSRVVGYMSALFYSIQ